MRSFSSLVCGMVGQHPQLYGLPEVNLFVADDVDGLLRYYLPHQSHGLHGLLRALAQIHHGSQTEETIASSVAWLKSRRLWPISRLLAYLCDEVAPKRCVDKSPVTVREPRFIQRMLHSCPDARYLHLTRHPVPTCRSIRRLAEEIDGMRGTHKAQWLDPERIWLRTNENIVRFTETLPLGQALRIQGEMLLAEPQLYLAQVCEWLEIDAGPDAIDSMLHPERSPYAGCGPSNARYGNDPNFLANPVFLQRTIPESHLDESADWGPGGQTRPFSRPTFHLARQFGYR